MTDLDALEALRETCDNAPPSDLAAMHAYRRALVKAAPDLIALAREALEQRTALSWHTTCFNCSRLLDSCYAETRRREEAEAEVARLRGGMLALGFCPEDGDSMPCETCGAGL